MDKAKKRVLIVEDNENNLRLEKDLLEVAGYEVLEAGDVAHGLPLAKKEKPDVIVLDVRLPDIRGTEMAKMLRADTATSSIPIVFVTASVMTEGLEEIKALKDLGAIGFISKPINTRTFTQEISQYIR